MVIVGHAGGEGSEGEQFEVRWTVAAADGGGATGRDGSRARSSRSRSRKNSSSSNSTQDGEGDDAHPLLWESGDSATDSASEAGDEVPPFSLFVYFPLFLSHGYESIHLPNSTNQLPASLLLLIFRFSLFSFF
jgi:hypothetical protein